MWTRTLCCSPGTGTTLDPPCAVDLPCLCVQKHLEKQPVLAAPLPSKITPSHQRIWSKMIQPTEVLHGVIGMFLNKLFLFFWLQSGFGISQEYQLGLGSV